MYYLHITLIILLFFKCVFSNEETLILLFNVHMNICLMI